MYIYYHMDFEWRYTWRPAFPPGNTWNRI